MPFGEGMTIWLGGAQGPDAADREPRRPLPYPVALSAEIEAELLNILICRMAICAWDGLMKFMQK